MKVKMTLHEVYVKLEELRKQRDLYSRIIAECLIENDEDGVKSFTDKFKRINEIMEYYSGIEVEFENKYKTES